MLHLDLCKRVRSSIQHPFMSRHPAGDDVGLHLLYQEIELVGRSLGEADIRLCGGAAGGDKRTPTDRCMEQTDLCCFSSECL